VACLAARLQETCSLGQYSEPFRSKNLNSARFLVVPCAFVTKFSGTKTTDRLLNAEIDNAEGTRNIGAARKARAGRGTGSATAGNFSGQRSPKNHATSQTNPTEIICSRHWAKPPLSHFGWTRCMAIRGHGNACGRHACCVGDSAPGA